MLVDDNFPVRQFCENSLAFLKLERKGPSEPPGPDPMPLQPHLPVAGRWKPPHGPPPVTCERGPSFCASISHRHPFSSSFGDRSAYPGFNVIFWIFIVAFIMFTKACFSSESSRELNRSMGHVCLPHPASSSGPNLPRPSSHPLSLALAISKILVPKPEQRSKTEARPGKILTSHRREHTKQELSAFKRPGLHRNPAGARSGKMSWARSD